MTCWLQVCAPLYLALLVIPKIEWQSVLKLSIIWGDVGGFLASSISQLVLSCISMIFGFIRNCETAKRMQKIIAATQQLRIYPSWRMQQFKLSILYICISKRTWTGLWASCIFSKLLCDHRLENHLHFPWLIRNLCRCPFWGSLLP